MYFDALSFLEDERDAWRPFEALLELSPEQLEIPAAGPDRWSGRDLLAHLVHWQEHALVVARELAVGARSPAYEAGELDWEERGGDVVNAEVTERGRAMSIEEVLARARSVPGELRGYLTVVPETRWIKNPVYERFFISETLDHYADHVADLAQVMAALADAAGPAAPSGQAG
jgi:hypothetical protein